MTPEKIIAYMDLTVEEYVRLEPREEYDPCIVGIGRRCSDTVLVYSTKAIIDMHVLGGMEVEEAVEFFEFNTVGGWFGNGTPIFLADTPDITEEWE